MTPDGTFPESVEFIQHIHQANKPLEEIGKAVVARPNGSFKLQILIGPVIITTLFCSWKTEQIVARLDQEKRDYRYVIHLFTHTTHPIDSLKKNVLRIHKLQLPLLLCVSLTLLWICISTGRKSSTENRNRNVCNVHSSEYKQHQQ